MSAPTDVAIARPEDAAVVGEPATERPPREPWWRNLDEWLGIAILVACCAYIFIQLQPNLLLRNTTASGGDMGAHVWWPAYLRDHLLPWRVSGWSPDFYAGFPAGQYYFPVPAVLIVALDTIIPYNIAFKLITAFGAVLVPIGAYVFAKGIRAPKPAPAAFAVAITAFLFFTGDPGVSDAAKSIAFNQRIMGGNLASTLAGEFSFTLALAFALFFFGSFAWALRTRQHLWVPAVFLAMCLMSHFVVGIFAFIGAFAIWVFERPFANFGRVVAIGGVGAALSAFWALPLVATISYTTNMRYEPLTQYTDYLFPRYFFDIQGWPPYAWGAYILIGIAIVASVGWLRRSTFILLLMTALCGLAFRFWTQLGSHVWNLRLLSFWYVGIHLLMAVAIVELIRGAGWLAAAGWRRAFLTAPEPVPSTGEIPVATLEPSPGAELGAITRGVSASGDVVTEVSATDGSALADWGRRVPDRLVAMIVMVILTATLAVGALVDIDNHKSFLPYWAKWNYSGYQNVVDEVSGTYSAPCSSQGSVAESIPTSDGETPLCQYAKTVATGKQWPEYKALMHQLKQLPPGRALWEGGSSLDKYGTPLALMLIPYWTKGRISSMEGVYFEASATTPYHFETVAALVATGEASNPVRGIPYRDQNSFDVGVEYLQALGVNYFIAHNPATKARADADSRLTRVATSPDLDAAEPLGWSIYRVADSPLVEGLAYEPVVADGVAPGPEGWEQKVAVPWFWFPDQLDKPVVADGPDTWRHAQGSAALRLPRRSVRPAKVTNVKTTDTSISFDVDRTGVPVLVKTSYFPNWKVDGAEGPYRATPNFMVVVPTEKHVTLTYGTTKAEWLGRFVTMLGLFGLMGLVWWGRRRSRRGKSDPGESGAESAGTLTVSARE